MTFKVVSRSFQNLEIIDSIVVDNWDEATEIAFNLKCYYDDYGFDGHEVVVSIEEYDEKGDLINA